jgi:hypothetical protein
MHSFDDGFKHKKHKSGASWMVSNRFVVAILVVVVVDLVIYSIFLARLQSKWNIHVHVRRHTKKKAVSCFDGDTHNCCSHSIQYIAAGAAVAACKNGRKSVCAHVLYTYSTQNPAFKYNIRLHGESSNKITASYSFFAAALPLLFKNVVHLLLLLAGVLVFSAKSNWVESITAKLCWILCRQRCPEIQYLFAQILELASRICICTENSFVSLLWGDFCLWSNCVAGQQRMTMHFLPMPRPLLYRAHLQSFQPNWQRVFVTWRVISKQNLLRQKLILILCQLIRWRPY